ncbi:MAG: FeoB-associated Cys-rich membrane protein [Clostridiales bacterium]|nr:FeoB-associated Cys-rich membrane protein [Clostridiales bacterium]
MTNAIVILVLLAVLGSAAAYLVKAKKSGVKCIGCPDGCKGCKGGCSCNQ